MKKFLLQYVNYNLWANSRIVTTLDSLDHEILNKNLISSFPTLRNTMYHIWDAEIVWINRMKNIRIEWPPSMKFDVNLPLSSFLGVSNEFIDFVRNKNEDFFLASTSYKNNQGEEFIQDNGGIIMHCMNHGTFHRGQIITMLRNVSVNKLPATDLISYFRETNC